MERICTIICILSTLMFMGCTGPMGPRGFMGFRGPDGKRGAIGQGLRGDFELLEANVLILKSSYYYNYQVFNSKRANFNNSIAFGHSVFQDEFNTDQPKDYVYASLRHDESDISMVERIVAQLTGNVLANNLDNNAVKLLLLALRDSAKYVYEFMDFFLSGVGLAKFRKYDEPHISELCAMVMDMFRQRESVLADIQSVLIDIRSLFKRELDIAKVRSSLNSIINIQGKVYEKIYIGNGSLKGLRDSVENKIDELKRLLVS
ncbi:hypothetical protein [Borrelia venezuelensis]|uniref:hypothetical protein n=1 Tax=Borrelia venezuelensis TaxID=1653839 RepID=UPI001FF4AFD1|nr:hypothetical protein [Borrelia venezuelensis]UPA12615.1 hypothetical protein bvRMA01_000947 [Borrelia venezuelensis]